MRNQNPYFISEVSSNHSTDLQRCLDFVDQTAAIGCDAVKFQLFKVSQLFSPEVFESNPEVRTREKWELPISFLPEIKKRCELNSIDFSVTPFYLEAVDELEPYVDFYKIASYELLWLDLLRKCGRTGLPMVISTGMATMEEIQKAVDTILSEGCKNLTVLHCTSAYPTPAHDANLSAIETMRGRLKCDIGWSDHTVKPGVISRAIHKWGAKVIEFHLDLDGQGAEFESGHCWLPHQMKDVIEMIREGFTADGQGVKGPVESELSERDWRADPSDGLRPLLKLRSSL